VKRCEALEFEAVSLTGCRVASNGSGAELAFADANGALVTLALPRKGVAALIMTLPEVMDELLRRASDNPTLKLAFPVADWRLEIGSDGESVLLTLETPHRFRVTFALGTEFARRIAHELRHGTERLEGADRLQCKALINTLQ